MTDGHHTERSGKCSACGYRIKLRANGTVGKHHLWQGRQYLYQCAGTGAAPAQEPS